MDSGTTIKVRGLLSARSGGTEAKTANYDGKHLSLSRQRAHLLIQHVSADKF